MTDEIKKKIEKNIWNIWSGNWKNAKRFFESKGNIKTRGEIKRKWFNEFNKDISQLFDGILEEKARKIEKLKKPDCIETPDDHLRRQGFNQGVEKAIALIKK